MSGDVPIYSDINEDDVLDMLDGPNPYRVGPPIQTASINSNEVELMDGKENPIHIGEAEPPEKTASTLARWVLLGSFSLLVMAIAGTLLSSTFTVIADKVFTLVTFTVGVVLGHYFTQK